MDTCFIANYFGNIQVYFLGDVNEYGIVPMTSRFLQDFVGEFEALRVQTSKKGKRCDFEAALQQVS